MRTAMSLNVSLASSLAYGQKGEWRTLGLMGLSDETASFLLHNSELD
jgi:hypothetical protein